MIRHHRAGAVLTTALLICTTTSIGITPTAHADTTPPPKILLMLDASGSMNGKDPSGLTKIEAAKKALNATIDAIPTGTNVGLRVYGATQPGGQPTPAACADTQLVAPLAPIDPAKLKSTINGFTAKGETPIAYSLTEAAKDLGPDGERHIILVSDGKESCATNPCDDVKKITGLGINLHIDTVGFNVDTDARKQLSCIADASQGTYYDATNADQLQTSLKKLSTRAARPFTVIGTPITGTPTPDNPPTIQAGDYTDTFPASGQLQKRFYKVKRTTPGSTITATLLSRFATPNNPNGWGQYVTTRVILSAPEGKPECGNDFSVDDTVLDSTQVETISVRANGLDPRDKYPSDAEIACAYDPEVLLELDSEGKDAPEQPFQLRILEEPPVTAEGLVSWDPAKDSGDRDVKASDFPGGPAQNLIGGARFDDAFPIQPGNYVTDLVPGEIATFSIKVGYGQQLLVKSDGPGDEWLKASKMDTSDVTTAVNRIYSPALHDVSSNSNRWGTYHTGWKQDSYVNATAPLLYGNRWEHRPDDALAGTYTVLVGVPADSYDGRDPQGKPVTGVPIPVRFSVAIRGNEMPAPKVMDAAAIAAMQASASPSATTTASATSKPTTKPSAPASATAPASTTEPKSPAPLRPIIGGTLVILAAAGGIGYVIWRRRH